MPKEKIKLTFEISILLHRKLKAQAAICGMSIKKYLTFLIETDLEQNERGFLLKQKNIYEDQQTELANDEK